MIKRKPGAKPKDAAGPRKLLVARVSDRARAGLVAEAARRGGSVGDLITLIGEGLEV